MSDVHKGLVVHLWAADYPAATLPEPGPSGAHFDLAAAEGWTDLGKTALGSPPEMGRDRSVSKVKSHQDYDPVRADVESIEETLAFVLLETTGTSLKMAFGGGIYEEDENGDSYYEPPEPWEVIERALILEVRDGAWRKLYVKKRTFCGLTDSITFPREGEDPIQYAITADVLGVPGEKPGYECATPTYSDGGS